MIDRPNRVGLLLLILAITAVACAPFLPAVVALPTQPQGAVGTFVAGTRAAAASETAYFVTPSSTATITRTPSRTPTITPTPTATIVFRFSTFTKIPTATKKVGGGGSGSGGSGGGGGNNENSGDEGVLVIGRSIFYCQVISVTPPNDSVFSPGETIGTITWRIKNTGNVPWDPRGLPDDMAHPNVDYAYKSGQTLGTYKLYDTPHDNIIDPGEIVNLTIGIPDRPGAPAKPAIAPNRPGQYMARWSLVINDQEFCTAMTFSFKVQ